MIIHLGARIFRCVNIELLTIYDVWSSECCPGAVLIILHVIDENSRLLNIYFSILYAYLE